MSLILNTLELHVHLMRVCGAFILFTDMVVVAVGVACWIVSLVCNVLTVA